jgi:hypothetical protein
MKGEKEDEIKPIPFQSNQLNQARADKTIKLPCFSPFPPVP